MAGPTTLRGPGINDGAFVNKDIDVLKTLRFCKWREISFHAVSVDCELAHDLVEHKYPDRDGAHVENTGRAPLRISAKVVFVNSLFPTNQDWGYSTLDMFPGQWDVFRAAMADKRSGTLVHPDLGPLQCKAASIKWTIDGSFRGGVMADCEWVETNEESTKDFTNFIKENLPDPFSTIENSSSAFTAALAAARAQQLGQLSQFNPDAPSYPVTPPKGPVYNQSVYDLVRNMRGVSDQVSLLSRRIANFPDTIKYQVNALKTSVNTGASSLRWPVEKAAQETINAANDIKKTLGAVQRSTKVILTSAPSTLAALASQLKSSVTDLVTLNPALASEPVVRAFYPVRYYAST